MRREVQVGAPIATPCISGWLLVGCTSREPPRHVKAASHRGGAARGGRPPRVDTQQTNMGHRGLAIKEERPNNLEPELKIQIFWVTHFKAESK